MVVHVEVSQEVYDKAAAMAARHHMNISEVFAAACAEHLAVWDRLEARAAQGDREKFMAVLAKVPGPQPIEGDRI